MSISDNTRWEAFEQNGANIYFDYYFMRDVKKLSPADLRDILDLKTDAGLAREREVATGQQFFSFAPPGEFQAPQESRDTRSVIRKAVLGRCR